MNMKQILFILDKMRLIEFNQSTTGDESIQLSALVSVFNLSKTNFKYDIEVTI